MRFPKVYAFEIAFLQLSCIMEAYGGGGVTMALPGTPGQRISDLCNGRHIPQKELAKKMGISPSQLSRIVSGETLMKKLIRQAGK